MLDIDKTIFRLAEVMNYVEEAEDIKAEDKKRYLEALESAAYDLRTYRTVYKEIESAKEAARKLFK